MQLRREDTDRFYLVRNALLAFVNERLNVVPDLVLRADLDPPPEKLRTVLDALWANDALIDAFVEENPADLRPDALALAASWKARRAGTFVVFRALQRHAVVIEDSAPVTVYGVLGLRTPLDIMLPFLPILVKGVLLPFEGAIVFDGALKMYSVHMGPNIRRRYESLYRAARQTGAIITSLAPASAPQPRAPAKKKPAKKKPESTAELKDPGRCAGCGADFSKRSIGRHLASCEALRPAPGAASSFHFVVEDPRQPEYWLHLATPINATLASVDKCLRETWLECCGHLSGFQIHGETFASQPDRSGWSAAPESSMREGVSAHLDARAWKYEYDYGSTTELRIRPLGTLAVKGRGVRVLARNLPPHRACVECGGAATAICSQCRWEDGGWRCARCAKKHPCGEEMMLPLVNSPRAGVCGYTG